MTTIKETIESLKARHIEYIEATYHVRHPQIIKERRAILDKDGGIASDIWLEGTPSYEYGPKISDLNLPIQVKKLLLSLNNAGLGVYDPLWLHQSEALEKFFNIIQPKDLVVATGTGSGKTEIFLYSLMGLLAQEGERNRTTGKRGFRAIILYPMNALVSDQVARLRKNLGDQRSASILRTLFGRTIQFGMYTSRTPYHGEYDPDKNHKYVRPLIKYFVEMNNDKDRQDLFEELQKRGRIPQKDLDGFLGAPNSPRETKYLTHPDDRELFTRQEMHSPNKYGGTPDILVTNYSMLEYMLLRPIEQPMFETTRQWLQADPDNQLLLVIDEAHLYRGSQGAEVALLIRRLLNHLKVPRERVRFILTSASLGSRDSAPVTGKSFAAHLTGGNESNFEVILGERLSQGGKPPLPKELGIALQPVESDMDPLSLSSVLHYFGVDFSSVNSEDDRRLILGGKIASTDEFKAFHDVVSGKPHKLNELGAILFPQLSEEEQRTAVMNMSLLVTWSLKDKESPLYPVKVHTMFRGLPKLYVCINRNCPGRQSKDTESILGPIFTSPKESCDYCHSRVYELMGHRTCGAIYLSAYFNPTLNLFPRFLWTQRGNDISLREVHLLLEHPRNDPDYNRDAPDNHIPLDNRMSPRYIELQTGYIYDEIEPDKRDEYLECWWPPPPQQLRKRSSKVRPTGFSEEEIGSPLSWKRCYACGIDEHRSRRQTFIMDHETRGEEPFANIVKTMFIGQAPLREITPERAKLLPNRGRKVLCFSDGRQKAARLARDLQRTIGDDSFRELLLLAAQKAGQNATIESLFSWIVYISRDIPLVLFDDGDGMEGNDYQGSRQRFLDAQADIARLMDEYDIHDIVQLLQNKYIRKEINGKKPRQYDQALLRALGDANFSVRQTMVGYVAPVNQVMDRILKTVQSKDEQLFRNIVLAIINDALENRVLDPSIRKEDRAISRRSLSFPRGHPEDSDDGLDSDKLLPSHIKYALEGQDEETIRKLGVALKRGDNEVEPLFINEGGKFWLNPSAVTLLVDVKDDWKRCEGCGRFSPYEFSGRCPDTECRGAMKKVDDGDLYVSTRKDFLRNPIQEVLGLRKPDRSPFTIRSEEHSAQLNSRDNNVVFGKAERYELLFQDVLLDDIEKRPQPIDVLSCTTTMEVGIDIGSLTAVALRTVPPRPDNYQQRAGRAGRRGTALSLITTFADNSPQEMYIFENPSEMIGVDTAAPTIYIQNLKILQRHINAALIQEFFQRVTESSLAEDSRKWSVFESLGTSSSFFSTDGPYTLKAFVSWIQKEIISNETGLGDKLSNLIPNEAAAALNGSKKVGWKSELIQKYAKELISVLSRNQDRVSWVSDEYKHRNLLSDLIEFGLLPTFGFPLDLCEFTVHDFDRSNRNGNGNGGEPPVRDRYTMSENLAQALSEYVPGREVVVDKHTFLSYGLYFPFTKHMVNRANSEDWDNLKWLNYCDVCSIVLDIDNEDLSSRGQLCQSGHEIKSIPKYSPVGFAPEVEQGRGVIEGRTLDYERAVVTRAELPARIGINAQGGSLILNISGVSEVRSMPDQKLIIRNYGPFRQGYKVCTDCGAVSLGEAEPTRHNRPYQLEPRFLTSSRMKQCNGHFVRVAFAHDFQTDLAILTVKARFPLHFAVNEAWSKAAAMSLSEALVLGATRTLGIDSAELAGNWRFIPEYQGDTDDIQGHIEFYMYDTTPGGAGFANEVANRFSEVLRETKKILTGCSCDTSCHKCLRTYENKYYHDTLTRLGALSLLEYAESGTIISLQPERSRQLLERLEHILEKYLRNVKMSFKGDNLLIVTQKGKNLEIKIRTEFLETRTRLMENDFTSEAISGGITRKEVSDYDILQRMPTIVSDIVNLLQG